MRARIGEPLRFLNSIPMEGEGCVTWPYCKNNMGYGQVYIGGRKHLAHRVACEKAHGEAPSPRHQAAHACGKGHLGCVAPWHLFWKTPVENAADKKAHGTHFEGPSHPHAKLSSDDLASISALAGTVPHAEISALFGVSQTIVSRRVRQEVSLTGETPKTLSARKTMGVRQMPNGRWQARAQANGQAFHLGTFPTRDAALSARLDWIAAQIGVTAAELSR